jgi:hypothetical protein
VGDGMKIATMSLTVLVVLFVLVVGFWQLHRHMVVSYAKTNLAHMYHISENEVTLERVQELGFWRDKLDIVAAHSWDLDFTVPGGPNPNSGMAFTCFVIVDGET